MRVMAIVGSSRRGNTYAMVEAACHGLKDCETQLVHLDGAGIRPCDGCLTCDTTGECHIQDRMQELLPGLTAAQGLIIGTPARWSLLSGELKVFLDRLNPLAALEQLKGKKAIILAVGQTEGELAESIDLAARSVRFFCDNAGVEVVDTVLATGCLRPDDLITKQAPLLGRCKAAAQRLHESLACG
jgi:multimeric flavodoxin WrbA